MTQTMKITFDWYMNVYAKTYSVQEITNLRRMLIRNTTTKAIMRSLFWLFNLFTSVFGFSSDLFSVGVSYTTYFTASTVFPATKLSVVYI